MYHSIRIRRRTFLNLRHSLKNISDFFGMNIHSLLSARKQVISYTNFPESIYAVYD